MAPRLLLKYGLVADRDRLADSADSLTVTEPATGSKSRTKGNLYLIVGTSRTGGRARDATALVAETIRHDYYYDESAGIAICLEKAFRSANRRLRSSREGHGLAPGAIGAAAAVVRGNELYVATLGDAEAYLVRAARLLMPEHEPGEGLPATDALRLDVWRGELAVGDLLLLVSRNLTEVVGTEELKNAVVTLHPQSAVEHLHHLFVAAGGVGSDAVLAIEATESTAARLEHRLVPVAGPDPYGSPAGRSPIPLADQVVGAASAVQSRAVHAREAMGDAFGGMVDRVFDIMPRRRTSYRRIAPAVSRRETQRRAAVGFLSFLGVILVLGLGAWAFPRDREDPIARINAGEEAYLSAQRRVNLALGAGNLSANDPEQAMDLLQEAWVELERAEDTGVPTSRVDLLRRRVVSGLDPLYGVSTVAASPVLAFAENADPRDLVRGPDGAAYSLDREARTVTRIDPQTSAAVTIVTAGDGAGEGIGTPMMLSTGGPDLVIADIRGNVWRWRPSDDQGRGTLGQLRLGGESTWGDDVIDMGTFLPPGAQPEQYLLYVADPSENQILRYAPLGDGSGFTAPNGYLATENEDVSSFRELLIDGDIYALTPEDAIRHEGGRVQEFELAAPPDGSDIRPGRDYGRFAATGPRRQGRLFVWDEAHGRIVVFEKADGSYVGQFIVTVPAPEPGAAAAEPTPPAATPSPPGASSAVPSGAAGSPGASGEAPEPTLAPALPSALEDVRGMYVVEQPQGRPPVLIWSTPDGLWRADLQETTPRPSESPAPSGQPLAPSGQPPAAPATGAP